MSMKYRESSGLPGTLVRGPRIQPLLSVAGDSLRRCWAVRPLPVTRAFERAVTNGTRTRTGEPDLGTALPVEPWLAGRRTQTIDIDAPARARIDIDPDRWYPAAHRGNNAWVRP
jgi:hypothetical protein